MKGSARMQRPFTAVIALPFGSLGIALDNDCVHELRFLPPGTPELPAQSAVARIVSEKIAAWVAEPSGALELPLATRGTVFQQRVRRALCAIPAGETRTYGELARRLDSAARAIGQACAANPFPLAVPCHRVVGAGGIGGFAHASDGYLISAKRWLLANEAR